MRRPGDAIIIFRKLLNIDPTNSIAHDCLAHVYHQSGDYSSAREHAVKALEKNPALIQSQLVLGAIEVANGNKVEALRIFDSVRSQVPGELRIEKAYAEALLNCGEFELAHELARSVIKQRPDYIPFYHILSSTHRFTPDDPDAALILNLGNEEGQLSRNQISPEDQVAAYMALFKVESDLGNLPKAFNYLRQAKALRKEQMPYSPEVATAELQGLKKLFSRAFCEQHKAVGSAAASPVFIVGMPRSGTTLLERIISSSPEVMPAGELQVVHQLRQELSAQFGENQHDLAALSQLSPDIWQQAGEEYIKRARRLVGDAQFFTDKMPGNYLFIGFIRTMLPNAKIIHLTRHPVANCLSIYEQDFAVATAWANDLTWLGMQYVNYRNVMDYWDGIFGSSLISVTYESLVNDTEATIARLSRELNIDLRSDRVQEAQQQGNIITASKWQARQPIHTGSVARWEQVQGELEPLLAVLEDSCLS